MNKLASSSRNVSPLRFIKRRSRRSGLTLIEILIASALTLVIISAMIRAFKSTSESISLGRAKMDMHNKVRVVSEQLRRDLQNATRVPNPGATTDGYFEYVEGFETDAGHFNTLQSFIGDHDDILALTVRSEGEPFRGRFAGGFVESYTAEVIWFVVQTDGDNYDGQFRLYRRVFLLRPDLLTSELDFATFYEGNDVSVRRDYATGNLVMNSLEDLSQRENRYSHESPADAVDPVPDVSFFPYEIRSDWVRERVLGQPDDGSGNYDAVFDPNRLGEDLMLDYCVAFDIKVFDPTAEVFRPDAVLIAAQPGSFSGQVIDYDDPGFDDPVTTNDVVGTFTPTAFPASYPQNGAYVNLGYDGPDAANVPPRPLFNNDRWFSDLAFGNNYSWNNKTYCTWWDGYESDGLDQDNDTNIDQGTDGIDNNGDGIIDDNNERETRPPYAYPVRSIEVRIRMIEKKSNQILQKTVRENFVPN